MLIGFKGKYVTYLKNNQYIICNKRTLLFAVRNAATVGYMVEKTQNGSSSDKKPKYDPIDMHAGVLAALAYYNVENDGRGFTCPRCGTSFNKKKTRIRPDGGITCHKCGRDVSTGNGWDTVRRLAELTGSLVPENRDIAAILLGKDPNDNGKRFITTVAPPPPLEPQTVVDSEVLEAIRQAGDPQAGERYWYGFHIGERVARAFDARVITQPWGKVWDELVDKFTLERLIEAGIAKKLDDGSIWTVPGGKIQERSYKFSPDYPVLQFYKDATGTPVGLEVRGNMYIESRTASHKQYQQEYAQWEAAGKTGEAPKKVYWTPKTRNLIGNAKGSRVGFGLDVVSRFPLTRVVWLVEGYKDALAAGAMGRPAIGLAGAKAGLSHEAIEVLQGRKVALAFDGDEAGADGAEMIQTVLENAEGNIQLISGPQWPQGSDVADQLAVSHETNEQPCAKLCGERKR